MSQGIQPAGAVLAMKRARNKRDELLVQGSHDFGLDSAGGRPLIPEIHKLPAGRRAATIVVESNP
jgi:hypothetical protein